MVASISPDPRLQFFANDGSPLVGGKLYTYAAGTTTPLTTYTSSSGSVANTNPVILDSRGEASVWLGALKYKFVLKDANDVEIWSQDNLQAAANVDGSNATGTWPINISGSAASVAPGGAVNKIVAGTNITISPTSGVGDVTINAASAGGTVTSINGAGLYGFTVTGGPITSSGTLTVTPPTPGTSGNVMVSNGTSWTSASVSAKAWARWNGVTGVITSSYNVSSIVHSATGEYTVNFTTALANVNYAPLMSCAGDVAYDGYGVLCGMVSAPTTSNFAMWTKGYAGGSADTPSVQIAVFGG